MKLLVTVETRFLRDDMGRYWVKGPSSFGFFRRYLTAFDEVCVLARVSPLVGADNELSRVDGPGVSVFAIPNYRGPAGATRMAVEVLRQVRRAVSQTDAMMLRTPGTLAIATWVVAPISKKRVYAAEVVGDPWDVFRRGVVDHPLRPLFRLMFSGFQRVIVWGAVCVGYVTDEYLQRRYPPGKQAYATSYSSASIPKDSFVPNLRQIPVQDLSITVVGSLHQAYKGVETVISAVAELRRTGVPASLVVVGGGRLQQPLEHFARSLGVEGVVKFVGQVPPSEVLAYIDRSHLLVSASRTEGVARAALEAMARSTPVVSTPVGGMREIVAPEAQFGVDDVAALVALLERSMRDPAYYASLVEHSARTAERYKEEVLGPRRSQLYAVLVSELLRARRP